MNAHLQAQIHLITIKYHEFKPTTRLCLIYETLAAKIPMTYKITKLNGQVKITLLNRRTKTALLAYKLPSETNIDAVAQVLNKIHSL